MEVMLREDMVPTEWEKSELVHIYKQESENCRGIKLLGHLMNIWERRLGQRL